MKRLFRLTKVGLFCLIITLVLWSLGLAWFLTLTDKSTGEIPAGTLDGIVVLTGGVGRIESGLILLEDARGGRLLISGVNPDVTTEAFEKSYGVSPTDTACCIDLDRSATDTITNASETEAWVTSHKMKSIWLVTASYHMPRALVLFREQMPDLKIEPWPVHASVSPRYFITEYHKFLITLIRSGSLPKRAIITSDDQLEISDAL